MHVIEQPGGESTTRTTRTSTPGDRRGRCAPAVRHGPAQGPPPPALHRLDAGRRRCATWRRSTASGCRASLTTDWPPRFDTADARGWFRFQRLYDAARACVRGEADMRRIVREAALDDGAEGSRWLEIQVDPTSYAPFVGGITPALEIVLDEARAVSAEPGAARVGVIVAASRMRHPLEARTLARLAARYAGDGAGRGRRVRAVERRAARGHGGVRRRLRDRAAGRAAAACRTPASCSARRRWRETLDAIEPERLGHGVRSVEDPAGAGPRRRAGRGPGGVPALERLAGGVRPRRTRCRCAPSWMPGRGWRSAPTTR